jgi:hypothetical protein
LSSDSRWSGGVANREWQRGTRPELATDREALMRQVRRYLADCRRFRLTPGEGMAVKVVFGPEPLVRAAYREATG